jgi:hypothetical protein
MVIKMHYVLWMISAVSMIVVLNGLQLIVLVTLMLCLHHIHLILLEPVPIVVAVIVVKMQCLICILHMAKVKQLL